MEQANTAVVTVEVETNVVTFPRKPVRDVEMPSNMEEAREMLAETRTYYANEVGDEAMDSVMQIFKGFGFFTNPQKVNVKDMVAIQEVMKAALLRYYNIEHPFQDLIDRAISLSDDELNDSEEFEEEG